MARATDIRSPEGEKRRLASLPSGKRHWNWSATPSRLTLHKRIYRKRGAAKLYPCRKNCGRQALDWALVGKEYSDNPDDYRPMCRKCHIEMDGHPTKVDRSNHVFVRDAKGRIVNTLVHGRKKRLYPEQRLPRLQP